jgi:hypothetical protein
MQIPATNLLARALEGLHITSQQWAALTSAAHSIHPADAVVLAQLLAGLGRRVRLAVELLEAQRPDPSWADGPAWDSHVQGAIAQSQGW